MGATRGRPDDDGGVSPGVDRERSERVETRGEFEFWGWDERLLHQSGCGDGERHDETTRTVRTRPKILSTEIRAVNTTATLAYLRLYNLTTDPTCSSATGFIESIPIPASATGAGFIDPGPLGVAYTTGIGYCVTGGSGNTDNSAPVAGVFVSIFYTSGRAVSIATLSAVIVAGAVLSWAALPAIDALGAGLHDWRSAQWELDRADGVVHRPWLGLPWRLRRGELGGEVVCGCVPEQPVCAQVKITTLSGGISPAVRLTGTAGTTNGMFYYNDASGSSGLYQAIGTGNGGKLASVSSTAASGDTVKLSVVGERLHAQP